MIAFCLMITEGDIDLNICMSGSESPELSAALYIEIKGIRVGLIVLEAFVARG